MKPLTPNQIEKIKEDCQTIYFKGDLHVYTGNRKMLYGKQAYEIKAMEGAHKDEIRWSYTPAED